jgi:hypothetical protein
LFDELDLVSTWEAHYGSLARTETLVLQEDGKYRQTFEDHSSGYSYRGEMHDWWTESRPGGGLYVHFDQMKMCDFEDECVRTGDSASDSDFYDFCTDAFVRFKGEMIMAVAGSRPYVLVGEAPRGIALAEMSPPGWEGPYYYFVLRPLEE